MDNSSYRSQYIASDTAKVSERSANAVSAFWKRVSKAEGEIGKNLEDGYSKAEYIELISKLNITSPNVLLPTKSRIGKYLKWLQEKGVLEKEYVDNLYAIRYNAINANHVYDSKYFKDFESLQSAIESTLWAAEKVDDSVFALQISAIYFAWLGLRLEDALQVKKDDIKDDCVKFRDRTIVPNSTIMAYLCDYRDAVDYESQAKGVIRLKYTASEWLFRTARSTHVDVPKVMRIFIRNFGLAGNEEANIFNYDKVYWSGIFSRAHEYEQENGEIEAGNIPLLKELFNEKYPSVSVAHKRLHEYQGFKQHFFSDSTSNEEA